MEKKIDGGATIWARKTIESDIFYWKPDVWFKIWFYIVNKVNHKDTKLFKRGSNFFNYSKEIAYINGSTIDQWKKCVHWLKTSSMISTKKSTRGVIIEVLNYAFYQDLNNYKAPQEAPRTALSKHYGSTTINKNDNNEKESEVDKSTSSSDLSDVREVPMGGEFNDIPIPEKKPKDKTAMRIQFKFKELCKKNLNQEPAMGIKDYKIAQFALKHLTEDNIYDLFDEWFGLGKPDIEAIQMTRALSGNQINSYKVRNNK